MGQLYNRQPVPTKKAVRIEIVAFMEPRPLIFCFSVCEIASDPVPFCKQKFLPSAISY
jgi:hypothetical protein